MTDLDSADDIAPTALLLQDAQDLLPSLEDASAKVGSFKMLRRQNICLLMEMNALPQSFLGMAHSSRRWMTLNILALLLPTARKTS